MDIISNLPDSLIDHILLKLPTNDRVKTSTLSRIWRFKWACLPSLTLDEEFCISINGSSIHDTRGEYAVICSSLVLQHRGDCLREFSLWTPSSDYSSFQHSIAHATRSSRSLERLVLSGLDGDGLSVLPSSIFSLINLKHLEIKGFQFHPPYWFTTGFPNLTRLVLNSVNTTGEIISRFVSSCPQLEEIEMWEVHSVDLKVDLDAPKLTHLLVFEDLTHLSVSNPEILKSLSMGFTSFIGVDVIQIADDIYRLLKDATELQHIQLWAHFCEFLGRCNATRTLPRFDSVKELDFNGVSLHNVHVLQCLLSFCANCPNLRELKIAVDIIEVEDHLQYFHSDLLVSMFEESVKSDQLVSMVEKSIINGNLVYLRRASMFDILGTKTEMKIMELLLCSSPVLEVMQICFHPRITQNAKLQCFKTFVNFDRASTKAKFHFPYGV